MSIHDFHSRLSSPESADVTTFLGGLRQLTTAEYPLAALKGYVAKCATWQLWDSTEAPLATSPLPIGR